MTDIFISYASEDRETARHFAEILEARGWDVWWDPEIPAGETFGTFIEARLDEAAAVIVLWSETSVNSIWVRAEASEALRRGKLIPVLIDNIEPPLVFRQIQTVPLQGWTGTPDTPAFARLAEDLTARLGMRAERETAGGTDRARNAVLPIEENRTEAEARDPADTAEQRSEAENRRRRRRLTALAVMFLLVATAGGYLWSVLRPLPEYPRILVFKADPTQVQAGEENEITWRTLHADKVILEVKNREQSISGGVDGSGSRRLRPQSETKAQLSAINEVGTATESLTISIVTPAVALPRIAFFNPDTPAIKMGESTNLSWSTENAQRVELNGTKVRTDGKQTVSPSKTTIYILRAWNSAGEVTQDQSVVNVAAPPRPRVRQLVVAGGGGPVKDSRVRDALAYAVPWPDLLAKFGFDNTVTMFEMPYGGMGQAVDEFPYSRERTKRLLAEAGYTDSLSVYLYVDNNKMVEFGTYVVEYLGRAGIKADLRIVGRDLALKRVKTSQAQGSSIPVLFLDVQQR